MIASVPCIAMKKKHPTLASTLYTCIYCCTPKYD